jgi:hypothetical protein
MVWKWCTLWCLGHNNQTNQSEQRGSTGAPLFSHELKNNTNILLQANIVRWSCAANQRMGIYSSYIGWMEICVWLAKKLKHSVIKFYWTWVSVWAIIFWYNHDSRKRNEVGRSGLHFDIPPWNLSFLSRLSLNMIVHACTGLRISRSNLA